MTVLYTADHEWLRIEGDVADHTELRARLLHGANRAQEPFVHERERHEKRRQKLGREGRHLKRNLWRRTECLAA